MKKCNLIKLVSFVVLLVGIVLFIFGFIVIVELI